MMTSSRVRLLFIEDEEDAVKPVIASLENTIGAACMIAGFAGADEAIGSFVPDIIILDLLQRGPSGDLEPAGIEVFDSIWNCWFCPIVIYSAQPDVFTEKRESHPFIARVQKGRRSQARLEEAISALGPQVSSIREAERHFRRELAVALRDVAPYAFKNVSSAAERSETIIRSARRRVAALMDDMTRHGQTLLGWEQYLCPPVTENIQLGDVLVKAEGDIADPASFRIVLTPSCDLVASGDRQPKVGEVLVARCVLPRDGIGLTSLASVKTNKLRNRLPAILAQGYFESLIPFPALAGRIPGMMANLRDLELISVDGIGPLPKEFQRVASIDSPFRELVAWAYQQIACRPGLPDRDFKRWSEEIMDSY